MNLYQLLPIKLITMKQVVYMKLEDFVYHSMVYQHLEQSLLKCLKLN
uniref:Hypotheticial protein n=1 Tax=Schistosoma japonicum TaxID=6182 RepID=C1LDY7_SCHJA|nr:hypotheticial protein [Schistosoma japonicum]